MRPLFDYEIGEEVLVVPLTLTGVVLQRCDRGNGSCDYQVVYWAEAKRCVDWLVSHEIRKMK